MENELKSETNYYFCQCCFSKHDLECMLQPCVYEDKIEIYSDMLSTCFSLKVTENVNMEYFICKMCIIRLRDCCLFRKQIIDVQTQFETKRNILIKEINESSLKEDIKQEYSSGDEYLSFFETKSEVYENSDITPESFDDTAYKAKKRKKINRLNNKNESISTLSSNIQSSKSKVKNNCNRKKRTKEELREHLRKYEKQKYAKSIPYKIEKTDLSCKICNETFTTNKNLIGHMPAHYPNVICHICGKFAITKKHLYEHIRSHSDEKVACQICNKLLKKASMVRHVQKHMGNDNIYACHYCKEKFPSYNTRLYHLAVEHQITTKRYKCKVCPKVFRFSGGLSTHVRRCHLQEKKCSCNNCGKKFFTKKELENHMLKHTKEKIFQCSVCSKSYGRKCTLNEHMKIHNNVKEYKCSVCERAFTQKCTLKGHMKVHEKNNIQMLYVDKYNIMENDVNSDIIPKLESKA